VRVLQGKDIPDYAMVYRVHGPFLFGATDKFAEIPDDLPQLPSIVILRLRNMTAIDATGIGAIRELADQVCASGRQLVLCGAREQPAQLMKQAAFERHRELRIFVPAFPPHSRARQNCTTRNLMRRQPWPAELELRRVFTIPPSLILPPVTLAL